MTKNKKKADTFASRRFILLLSLVAAFLVWVVVAGFIDRGRSIPITNVLIDYSYNEASYLAHDLMIVTPSKDIYTDVRVTGDSAEIAPLSFQKDAVTVYPDYSRVTQPGTYDLALYASKAAPGSWRVTSLSTKTDGHSLDENPYQMVTLTFEKVETKTLPVTVQAENVSAAPGFFTGTPLATPESVTLRGPKSKVDMVSRVVASLAQQEELTERKRYMGVPIILQDENGQPISAEDNGIIISPDVVEVDISVLVLRTMHLTVDFVGLPAYFDTAWFNRRVHLSSNQVEVVGPAAAFEAYGDTIVAETFDASSLSLNWESGEIAIPVPEDSGLRVNDEQRTVTAYFDTTGLVVKTFEVPVVAEDVVNTPANADIAPIQDTVTVKLLGPPEQIDALLPENITVEIDASGMSAARSGQQDLPARVRVPAVNRCIPLELYSILCNVEPHS